MKWLFAAPALVVSLAFAACASAPAKSPAVVSIVISKTTLNLVVGGAKETLSAYVLPFNAAKGDLLWSTSNPAVATVDSRGQVTALSKGTAVLIVTSEGKSATCKVIVDQPTASVKIDSIDQYYYNSLDKYDTYATVYITITNTGALPIASAGIALLATCDDGSTYQGGGNGVDIAPGSSKQIKTYIDVAAKHVTTVVIEKQDISYH